MTQTYKTTILRIDTVLYTTYFPRHPAALAGRCSGCVVWPALCSAARVLCRPLPRLLLTPLRGARSWSLETDVLPASVKTGLVWAAVSSWGEEVGELSDHWQDICSSGSSQRVFYISIWSGQTRTVNCGDILLLLLLLAGGCSELFSGLLRVSAQLPGHVEHCFPSNAGCRVSFCCKFRHNSITFC